MSRNKINKEMQRLFDNMCEELSLREIPELEKNQDYIKASDELEEKLSSLNNFTLSEEINNLINTKHFHEGKAQLQRGFELACYLIFKVSSKDSSFQVENGGKKLC